MPDQSEFKTQPRVIRQDWVFASILFCLGMRLILSACLGTADDEAYYWDWSRHMDWSYFDHPGMTAWMIRASTSLLGDIPLAVRLPGLLCHFGAWALLWQLARELFDDTVALLASVIYLFVPIYGLASLLMTPDAPMALFWVCTLFCLWRIGTRPQSAFWSTWGYGLLGISLGLGMLSKYTIVLIVPSGLVWLAVRRQSFWRSPWFWLSLSIGLISATPILLWNHLHQWPSIKFHLVDRQSGGFSLIRGLQFLGSQLALLTPVIFVGAIATLISASLRLREKNWFFIFIMSAPIAILFTCQSFMAEFKPHWPAPGFLLTLGGMVALWRAGQLPVSRSLKAPVMALMWFLLLVPSGFVYLESVYPIAPKVARQLGWRWSPQWDAANDFYGWDTLATHLIPLQKELPDHPVLASWRYQLTSQLAFATQQQVWRLSGQDDEYNYIQNLNKLKGKSILFVNDNRYKTDPPDDFESCEKLEPIMATRFGEIAREFEVWYCRNYLSAEAGQ